MSDTLHIAVLLGTARIGSVSHRVAQFVADIGKSFDGVEITLVDPKDLDLPGDGNDDYARDHRFTEITKKADAFFIVTPEYNHSYPGSLKRMLDSEFKNYFYKPVAVAGVSDGLWGGIRAIEHLAPVLRNFNMFMIRTDVQFPEADKLITEDGELQDEKYIERVKRSYTELIWMAKVLKYGKENVPAPHHESK